MTSPSTGSEDLAAPWRAVKARIASAAAASGRPSDAITLVAVSKRQDWSVVEPVLLAGQRVFGENRVQEAQERWTRPKTEFADLELRLIGSLQTNKAGDAVRLFDVVETLDRDRLCRALADAAAREGRCPRLLVEVNLGEEPQKAGVAPGEVDAFIARARGDYDLPVEGLMCIPPEGRTAFPYFALLGQIARRNGLTRLSMGMSADYETAIRFGATSVRVGSAIFGQRA